MNKPLTAAMDNVLAFRLGKVALAAGTAKAIGDYIDRGLLLRRLMEESGFGIVELPIESPSPVDGSATPPA